MHEEARSYPRNLHLYMRTHICLPAELPLKTLPRPAQQATRPFPSTMLVNESTDYEFADLAILHFTDI